MQDSDDLRGLDKVEAANQHAPDAHTIHSEAKAFDEPPDGDFRAWMQVLGGFLIFFNIWGFPISFGAFQIFYELHYLKDYSASNISWIGTTQGFLLILVGVFGGPLYDLGYFRELIFVGSFLTTFGFMMLSLSTEYWQVFLSQGVCAGLGCGLLYVPSLALVAGAFKKKRAIAMGFVTSGVALGGVVYTIMFQQLLPVLHFPWTARVMAFTALATFLVATALLIWIPITSTASSGPKKESAKARALFDKSALTSLPFLVFTIAQFLIFAAYPVPLFYIPVFGQVAAGLTNEFALWILVISQATSLAGRLATSLLAQYCGSMIVWTTCGVISGLLCLVWIVIDDKGGLITFGALYGFISGALVALPPTVFPLVSPDPATLGTRMGMSWAATSIAFLIGSPIAGALMGGDGATNFLGVQAWSGAVLLAGSAALAILWVLIVRSLRSPERNGTEAGMEKKNTIWI